MAVKRCTPRSFEEVQTYLALLANEQIVDERVYQQSSEKKLFGQDCRSSTALNQRPKQPEWVESEKIEVAPPDGCHVWPQTG